MHVYYTGTLPRRQHINGIIKKEDKRGIIVGIMNSDKPIVLRLFRP